MAIGTYSELQTAVQNTIITTYAVARIQEWIALGEGEVYRRLRIREMETTTDLTVTAGTREVALPTRYVGTRRLYLSTDPVRKLDFFTPDDFWSKYISSKTGPPEAYTVEGENIVLGPSPDTGYTGKHLYFQALEALSDSNTTNSLLTKWPDLFHDAAMYRAFMFKGGETGETRKWLASLDRIVGQIEIANERDRYPYGDLQRRTDSGHP